MIKPTASFKSTIYVYMAELILLWNYILIYIELLIPISDIRMFA